MEAATTKRGDNMKKLLILALLMLPCFAWASPAVVSHTIVAAPGTTSAINTTGSSCILLYVDATSYTTISVSDSQGNTWSYSAVTSNSGGSMAYFWVANPSTNASHTFTIGGVTGARAAVLAMSGTNGCTQDSFPGFRTALQTFSLTPTVPDMIIASVGGETETTTSASINSGFTISDYAGDTSGTVDAGLAYLSTSSLSAVQPTWTLTGESSFGSGIIAIQAAVTAAPTFSVASGTYPSSQTVTLSSSQSGSTIIYTTGVGNTPTANPSTCAATNGTAISNNSSITVSSTEVVNAIACYSGYINSASVTAGYGITSACPTGYAQSGTLIVPPQSTLSGNLYQFPTLFTGSFILPQAVTSASGTDVIFCSSAGALLPFEKVTYSSTSGLGEWWIAAPVVYTGSTNYTAITVYWGKSGASDQSCGPSGANNCGSTLWAKYAGVWHFPNGTTLSGTDSTGNNNATFTGSPTATTGEIDGAALFASASSQYGTIGVTSVPSAGQAVDVSAWVKPTAATGTQTIASRWNGTQSKYDWILYWTGSALDFFGFNGAGTNVYGSSGGTFAAGSWEYIEGTYDGGTNTFLYVNNTQQATNNNNFPLSAGTGATVAYIGQQGGGSTNYLNATLDELRISGTLTSDWRTAAYLTASAPTSFAQFHPASVPGLNSQWYVVSGSGVENQAGFRDCSWPEQFSVGGGFLSMNDSQQSSFCPGGTSGTPGTRSYQTSVLMANTFNFTYPATIQYQASMPPIGGWWAAWTFSSVCQSYWQTNFSWSDGATCTTNNEQELDFPDYLSGTGYSSVTKQGSGNFNYCYGSSGSYGCPYTNSYTFTPNIMNVVKVVWASPTSCQLYLNGTLTSSLTHCPSDYQYQIFDVFMDSGTDSGTAPSYPISMILNYNRVCAKADGTDCVLGDPTIKSEDEFGSVGSVIQNLQVGGTIQ
jgi:hypothetical protein